MNRISMERPGFGEDKIIERIEASGLRYNTKISKPENCEVVIVTHDSVQRMKNLDGNLLNPQKKTLFGGSKMDSNDYIVFFMDTAFHDASWGGNVQYVDDRVGGIQEKVNIRATFSFKIARGDRALSLLSETKSRYSKRYLVDKLRLKIDNTIKAYVCQTLMERGFIDTQQDILGISERAQEKLNQDILSSFGMVMSNLNIILEEDIDHATQRGELEWNAIREKDKGKDDEMGDDK